MLKQALIDFLGKFRPNILLMLCGSGLVILGVFAAMVATGAPPLDAWEAVKTPFATWIGACISTAKDLV